MIPASCKRLIEVDFPIGVVSEHSAREKSIRHGHPSTLHLWWARRPLAACRAVLMGLLLPDPCDKDCPPDFKPKAWELLGKRFNIGKKSDQELRELLLKFIGELANWDNASNSTYLDIARGLVKAAHPEETPVVVDPFAGGGSIPLEALRLGCEAFASDLNPVACLILKTLLANIPKQGNADFTLKDDGGKSAVVHGLAEALRFVGVQTKLSVDRALAKFYPVDADGSRPIAYLWARTVRCEAVGCGAEIPLVRSFILSSKAGRKWALRYRVERIKGKEPHLVLDVFKPKTERDVQGATVESGKATCPCCGVVLPAERVRAQLVAQSGGIDVQFDARGKRTGGALLLAVVTVQEEVQGRSYRLPTQDDYAPIRAAYDAVSRLPFGVVPAEPVNPVRPSPNARGLSAVTRCGVRSFGDLFTARQKLALVELARHIRELNANDGKNGALNEALAFAVGRCADFWISLARWKADAECPVQALARQALPNVWDFAEASPVSSATGSLASQVDRIAVAIEAASLPASPEAEVRIADACHSPLPSLSAHVWFTDPPYYDSIPYADLSDFFYVWLKRAVPDHALLNARTDATTGLTPKTEECVWNQSYIVDGHPKDGAFFERAMASAFVEGRRTMREDAVACVVFAHKTTEGWEALLSGMMRAGFVITASWPITTEMATRMVARDSAALAGSVHLVCRPRAADAGVGDWGDVKAAMERRIREWLPTLAKHGVRGADAVFSCLGPALESYSRYDKVLTAADHEVPLGGDPEAAEPHKRGFLAYVFEAVSKEALRQVLGDADTEGFEEDARLTALFLWTLQASKSNGNGAGKPVEAESGDDDGDDDKPQAAKAKGGFSMPFDTFIRITRPMGIHYPALEGRVIEIDKGVARLLPIRDRSEQLLGEAAAKPDMDISLKDIRQLELGLGIERQKQAAPLPTGRKKGAKKASAGAADGAEIPFTTLDRIQRAMLLFSLGRSTLLREVLEQDMRQGKQFERLALALNALYPDGCDERRMLEGVQAAMRGVR